MPTARATLIILAVSLLSHPAFAHGSDTQQVASSTSADSTDYLIKDRADPTMLATLRNFAECVVERDSERARAFLKSALFARPGNQEVRTLVATNDGCLGRGELKFNQVLFAGAAAEAIYRENGFRFADHPPAFPGNNPETLRSFAAQEGLCVTAKQPADVDELLRSPVGSAEEMRAILALRPAVEMCMPRVQKTPEMIRAVIAAGAFPSVASSLKVVE
ncbi:MAG TPA: hypothetical protein VNJ05_04260 [Sphingomicrobium sp.]|nr:hypothetical protein [Sphingomicrobium sp.]